MKKELEYSVAELFPSPFMICSVENHEKNKSMLKKYYDQDHDGFLRKDTKNDLFSKKDLKKVEDTIKKYCLEFYNNICGFDISIEDILINSSWFNIVKPGNFLYSHCHRNSHISGIYYLEYDETHPPLIIEKNNVFREMDLDEASLATTPKKATKYNCNNFTYKPKEGEMCIFPSYMWHKHLKNNSDTYRISFCFNSLLTSYEVGNGMEKSYRVKIEKKH